MIIVSGSTTLKPGMRDAVLASAIIYAKQSRSQPGCRTFVISADIEDLRVIHHYEEWDDAASLDAHLVGDHHTAFEANIGQHIGQRVAPQRHEVSSSAPLLD